MDAGIMTAMDLKRPSRSVVMTGLLFLPPSNPAISVGLCEEGLVYNVMERSKGPWIIVCNCLNIKAQIYRFKFSLCDHSIGRVPLLTRSMESARVMYISSKVKGRPSGGPMWVLRPMIAQLGKALYPSCYRFARRSREEKSGTTEGVCGFSGR